MDIVLNLKKYFPFLAGDATRFIKDGPHLLIVELKDDTYVLYNDLEKTFRNLPRNGEDLSEEEFRREFGYRLNKLMLFNGISQTELSNRTGITQSRISGYINGKVTPSFYKVDKIAKAIGCSTDDLRYVIHKKGSM